LHFGAVSVDDGEQPPGSGNALAFVLASVLEVDAGARHKVGDRARDQDLAGICQGLDPGGNVYGDTASDAYTTTVGSVALQVKCSATNSRTFARTIDTLAQQEVGSPLVGHDLLSAFGQSVSCCSLDVRGQLIRLSSTTAAGRRSVPDLVMTV
jgi:hypothetical protein